jgi:hypothetical protein
VPFVGLEVLGSSGFEGFFFSFFFFFFGGGGAVFGVPVYCSGVLKSVLHFVLIKVLLLIKKKTKKKRFKSKCPILCIR